MIKNTVRKNKCASIDISNDLSQLDNLSNPYTYSFGKIERKDEHSNASRLQNRTTLEYLYKK